MSIYYVYRRFSQDIELKQYEGILSLMRQAYLNQVTISGVLERIECHE